MSNEGIVSYLGYVKDLWHLKFKIVRNMEYFYVEIFSWKFRQQLLLPRKYLRRSWLTHLITPNGNINPYEKRLSVSVVMSNHKLFWNVRAETRIVGLLQC